MIFRLVAMVICCFRLGAEPTSSSIVRGTDQFEFVYQADIPSRKERGRIWLPIAQSNQQQSVDVLSVDAPGEYRITTDRDYGNRILVMDLLPAPGGKAIKIRYRVERRENAGAVSEGSKAAKLFLRPNRLVPLNSRLSDIARTETIGESLLGAKAHRLYWHTLDRMKYDKSGTGWGRGDAMFACDSRTGNCTDFHAYFIGLARTIKLPARFAIGFTIPADQDAGNISGYHCWAEFLADDKWTPVDISEADKHPELKDYYLGHHPANRFQFTVGRDLKLDPAPTSGPVNYLIYPLFEEAGRPVKTSVKFTFRRLKN